MSTDSQSGHYCTLSAATGKGVFGRGIRIACFLLMMFLAAGMLSMRADADSAEKTIYRYLTDDADLSPAAACGIMGNMQAESGFISDLYGLGRAYGLCQLTVNRTARLRQFCASKKLSSASAEGQTAFLIYELQTFYPKVFAYLESVPNTAQGAYMAASYFCVHFEAPANTAYAAGYRGNIARNQIWPAFGETALYLTSVSGGKDVKLKWTGKWTGKLAVMRSKKRNGTYKRIDLLDKPVYSYTDKTVRKKVTYYYYLLPVSGKKELEEDRSNKVSAMSNLSVEDEDCTIELSRTEYVYNGKTKKPKVTVWYKGKKLKKGKHYRVAYKNNVDAGKAVVTVSGMGDYSGNKKIKFRIKKAPIKVRAKDLKVVFSKERVVPVFSVKGPDKDDCRYRLKSENHSVAVGKGSKIRLRGSGQANIVLTVKKSKNYVSGSASFTLTVKPSQPEIRRVSCKKKKITVSWKAEGAPDGYEVMYSARKKFGSSARVITLEGRDVKSTQISVMRTKKSWRVRVRSYKMTESGQKLYSEWSDTAATGKK